MSSIIRRHKFHLHELPDSAAFGLITTELSKQEGIVDIKQTGHTIIVDYDLTKTSMHDINVFLSARLSVKQASAFESLIQNIKQVVEENTRQHSINPAGWDYYVQQLYLSSHDSGI